MANKYTVSGTMEEMKTLLGSNPFSKITELEINDRVFTDVKIVGLMGKNNEVKLVFTAL